MRKWLTASLYRKLILSHVAILMFFLFLVVIGLSVGYRFHIRDMMQQRFATQTGITFTHLKEELEFLNPPKAFGLPDKPTQPKKSKPAKSPSTSQPSSRPSRRKAKPSVGSVKARDSKNKHEALTSPKNSPWGIQGIHYSEMEVLCQRAQESSLLLGALVSVQNANGTCLLEAYPGRLSVYLPGKPENLPPVCRRVLPHRREEGYLSVTYSKAPAVSLQPGRVTFVQKQQHCKHLKKRKHWGRRHGMASYVYPHKANSLVVNYISGPKFHEPGPLPFIWLGFMVLLVIGIGLLTIPISRSITRPMNNLMAAVRRIQGGDLSQPIQAQGHDEVSELSKTVEEMRSGLLQHQTQRRALLADISHEIRTPLSRIRTVGESVADGLMREDKKLTQAMEGICKQVDEIDQLVGDLLDIARLEIPEQGQLTYQSVNLRSLLQEMERTLSPAAQASGKTIKLGNLPENLPEVPADFRRLRQVLNNLLQNAIRYSPDGGRITLSAHADNDWLQCEVCDQGVGVPKDEREKIFERLYRTDSSRSRQTGGQGLGLAITKGIILAHKGQIGVKDAPDGGACFWFKLPLQR
ncbi:MAG: HAMP domain-containing protein [Deltaproteobacteria bacterium]|nr:MAG: HAMP domain-containing protein [Deltaproteobacteria bacterium]